MAIAHSVLVSIRDAARAGEAGVGVEVVPVGEEDVGEAVGRVGDLDLDPGQAALEEGAEVGGPGTEIGLPGRAPGGDRRLEAVLGVAVDEMVVVVAGEEDQPLAAQLLGGRVKSPSAAV